MVQRMANFGQGPPFPCRLDMGQERPTIDQRGEIKVVSSGGLGRKTQK